MKCISAEWAFFCQTRPAYQHVNMSASFGSIRRGHSELYFFLCSMTDMPCWRNGRLLCVWEKLNAWIRFEYKCHPSQTRLSIDHEAVDCCSVFGRAELIYSCKWAKSGMIHIVDKLKSKESANRRKIIHFVIWKVTLLDVCELRKSTINSYLAKINWNLSQNSLTLNVRLINVRKAIRHSHFFRFLFHWTVRVETRKRHVSILGFRTQI